jgi:hypothetical protein
MMRPRFISRLALVTGLALPALVGCSVQRSVASGQLDAVERGVPALHTFHDFEASRLATYYLLGRLEGWHRLNPEDQAGALQLARYWGLAGELFIADDLERAAEASDQAEVERHAARLRQAYERASRYAARYLELRDPGFQQARETKTRLTNYLANEFSKAADAEPLSYVAAAFVGHAITERETSPRNASRPTTERLEAGPVGVALLERSLALDANSGHGLAHVLLGRYFAHQKDLARARKHFESAEAVSKGQYLPALQYLARSYYCHTTDAESYEGLLDRIAKAKDPLPLARLENGVAQRRAVRYLKDGLWQKDCLFSAQ